MLSYLTNALNLIFFLTLSKIPTHTGQGNSLKICSIYIYYQRVKPNLKSLS